MPTRPTRRTLGVLMTALIAGALLAAAVATAAPANDAPHTQGDGTVRHDITFIAMLTRTTSRPWRWPPLPGSEPPTTRSGTRRAHR